MHKIYNLQFTKHNFSDKRNGLFSPSNHQSPTLHKSQVNNQQSTILPQSSIINQQFFPAFTIAELMVAMVVLIIMLGMTGLIYKSASEAVNHNNATTELYQTAEAIRRQIQADVNCMTKDSVLILARRDITTGLKEVGSNGKVRFSNISARADKLLITSAGIFTASVKLNDGSYMNISSNMARILYGHGIPVEDPNYGDSAAANTIVNRWIFARKVLLYKPGYTLPSNAETLLDDVVVVDDDTGEAISLAQDMKLFQTTPYTYCNDALGVSMEIKGGGDPDIFALNCGEVKIRFLLPTEDANHNGTLDSNEKDGYSNWPPDNGDNHLDENVWLDLPDPSTAHYVFFSADSDLMPKALEFTIRLYDRNLTITSFDEETNSIHAGKTFRFLIRLAN